MYIQENTTTIKKYTLGRSERVKSRKIIDQIFKEGNSFFVYPLRTYFKFIEGEGNLKAGFTVSSRNFRKAVERNRIKRLMRETYRLQKNILINHISVGKDLAIFFLYAGKDIADYGMIKEKMAESLQKMSRIIDESAASNS